MGQKVHPLGFRVGITKKHQSQWFARFQKYGYSQSVLEDHMLRKTLLNLFSNLEKENALATKQSKKPGANVAKMPKITQILIERGLIPYEIGIQIHSDDCLAITKAIDNIKISKDLVSNLQKTRKYLFKVGTQLKNALNTTTAERSSLNDSSFKTKGESTDFTDKSKKRKIKFKKVKSNKYNQFSRRKTKKKIIKISVYAFKKLKETF